LLDAFKRWLLVGPVLLYSVILHEMAHGFVALLNGDPTALDAGRLTLNPIPHIDLWGSILVPAVLILTRVPFFIAWAKPVPYDPSQFAAHPRLAGLEVALAGPLTNLALAVVLTVVLRLLGSLLGSGRWGHRMRLMLVYGIVLNCTLMVFNFLPLPPLDGSKVLVFFLPQLAAIIEADSFYLQVGVLMLIMLVPQVSRWLIFRPSQKVAGALLRWGDPSAAWRLS